MLEFRELVVSFHQSKDSCILWETIQLRDLLPALAVSLSIYLNCYHVATRSVNMDNLGH